MIKYVISAPYGFMQLKRVLKVPEAKKYFEKHIKEVNELTHNDIEIIFLLNAFTEKDEIKDYRKQLGNIELMLDSGGLQMVTLGLNQKKDFDLEKEKKKVYTLQAMYGDYNMSFDEIPKIKITNDDASSGMVDQSRYRMLEDKFYDYGEKSGKNLKEQIEIFKAIKEKGLMKYKGKILPILQNYKIKQAYEYAEGILKNISENDKEFIGGISLGGLVHDPNLLNSLKICYYVINNQDKLPSKELLHFLGIGSINRALPFIILYSNGIIPFKHISFDSSRYVKLIDYGQFDFFFEETGEFKNINMKGTELTDNAKFVLENCFNEMQPQELGFKTVEEFIDWSYYWGKKRYELKEKYGNKIPEEYLNKIYVNRMIFIIYQIRHLAKYINSVYHGNLNGIYQSFKNEIKIIQNIKSIEAYNQIAEKYDTHPVKAIKSTNTDPLEDW